MKLRELTILGSLLVPTVAAIPAASAGGLFLPGSGAISTSRAGAALTSADDGEALSVNPAGMAKAKGTTITISAAFIQYSMQFTRRGSYEPLSDDTPAYVGEAYPTVKNEPDLPLGIGSMQPVPVVAVITDLGGKLGKKLRLGAGLYAPNAYPFRDMTNGYVFNSDFAQPPPPTRYDIMKQEAAVILPSIAVSYQITPELDVGLRLSWGYAKLSSMVAIWALPGNIEESVKRDGIIDVEAHDNFVPTGGLGVNWRPTPQLEIGAAFTAPAVVQAKGDAVSEVGPNAAPGGTPVVIEPPADQDARCAPGGTAATLKACIGLQLPMTATIGARYKILDGNGTMKGDLELNLGWENWGKTCDFIADPGCTSPGQYRVVVDAVALGQSLKDSVIEHGLKNTYSVRLGGSYHIPVQAKRNTVIVRGGVGFDTRAAKDGWLRADIDGAARLTTTLGVGYRAKRFEINAGGGFIYEGAGSNSGNCNPQSTTTDIGCRGDGTENPIEDRRGPDPINPLVVPKQQLESPVTQGDYKSHYVLLMFGMSTWF